MRRTLLFLPGNNPGNLQSGAVFGADGIILDLEDSVSPAEKDAARLLVASALKSVDYAGVERAVRINTLATGGEDYTASLGTQRTREGRELIFARGMLANAAAAAGIDSIDAPFADTNDPEGLFLDTQNARTFGFKGKFAINPRQISVIHKAFAPTAKEIAWAKRILVVIEEAQKKGAGVIALDGKMVDAPIVARARRTIHMADMLGLLEEE